MKAVWRVLKGFAYRVHLYFLGIHFCELKVKDEPLVETVQVRMCEHFDITFHCYRKVLTDFLFIRGHIEAVTYNSYYIKASFSSNTPIAFVNYDNKTLYFNGAVNHFGMDEKVTVTLLVDIYLDYLKTCVMGAQSVR